MNYFPNFNLLSGYVSLGMLLIQQIIVGVSTYSIIVAMEYLIAKEISKALFYVYIFSASLIIVYIPSAASQIYLKRWIYDSFYSFIQSYFKINRKETILLRDNIRKKKESWLTNEALNIHSELCSALYEFFSAILNVAISLIIIAFLISIELLSWYILAAIFVCVLNLYTKHIIKYNTHDFQHSSSKMNGLLLKAWPNIHSGNCKNRNAWFEQFSQACNLVRNSSTKLELSKSIISSIAALGAVLFISIGNYRIIDASGYTLELLAALFMTLPRQLQILQVIFHFYNVYLRFSSSLYRYKDLIVNSLVEDHSYFSKINSNSLSAKQKVGGKLVASTLNSLIHSIQHKLPSRYLIEGGNGSGKSTFLAAIKFQYDDIYFIPTDSKDLIFKEDRDIDMSTGQIKLTQLQRLIYSKDWGSVILLDEWDANLDLYNIRIIDNALDELSLTRTVVEVRHHR